MSILDIAGYTFSNPEEEEKKKLAALEGVANVTNEVNTPFSLEGQTTEGEGGLGSTRGKAGKFLKDNQKSIGKIGGIGMQMYNSLSTEAGTDKQADGRTFSTTMQGAGLGNKLGSVIGGPLGGAIGAGVGGAAGLVAGMIKKKNDRINRNKREFNLHDDMINSEIAQRSITADDYNKQVDIDNMMNLKKAQMGLLNFKY